MNIELKRKKQVEAQRKFIIARPSYYKTPEMRAKAAARQARYRLKYPEKANRNDKEKAAERTRRYRKKHPDKIKSDFYERRTAILKRLPNWLSEEHRKEIRLIYKKAHSLKMQVDHIVPLRGKVVSGLHVPWNLQVLAAKENRLKSNKFI